MEYFRRLNRQSLLCGVLLLAMALICAQGVGLHIHGMEGHGDYHSHEHAGGHVHMGKAHYVFDVSHHDHKDHHDTSDSQIDLSPDGLLKNAKTLFAIALIVFLFILLGKVFTQRILFRRREYGHYICNHYIISPPLRAPPRC